MVLDGKSSKEYPVDADVPQGFIIGSTYFLICIDYLPDDVICNILIYADYATLYCVIRHLICGSHLLSLGSL